MGTARKLEQIVCGALDELGYCRFLLRKCDDIKPEECPNVKDLKELH